LSLLGPFKAFLEGEAIIGFESNKVRALLAYLAADAERPQRRALLADLLWPDWPEKSAMRNLTFALVDLRKNIADRQAQPPFLLINRDGLQLNRASEVQVDLWDFNRLTKTSSQASADRSSQISQLKSAIDLYHGAFLEGFSLADSAPYEEWLASARQVVNQEMVKALGELVDAYLEQKEYEQGLPYARRRVELEPWLEEGHQQLMRLLAFSGQRSLALAQFETCRRALKDEFGAEPGKETTALVEQIRAGTLAKAVPLPEPSLVMLDHARPKHNLPVELTRFFGREAEILQVKERLAEWRLVTLIGAGGVGKTRLVQQVAAEVLDDYRDGVWFVALATLSDPELVAQQVATSLGLREEVGQPGLTPHAEGGQPVLERLKGFLFRRNIMLVLDNCEHLRDACARLADSLLHTCPQLKILATSREPLGVAGEAIFRVPSLPFPAHGLEVTTESIDTYAAVQLFSDRARQIQPGYQVTPQNASAVARICQRLDGIPLAIELAAARLSVLTAEELAARLDDVFHLLTGGSRAALPRHQTLRATMDWSYHLLSDRESRLLRRLAVFAGGWDLAGAEGVCAGPGLEVSDILELLANLVNKSMVVAFLTKSGGTRYRMLETIRQYAREKLLDSGEMAALQQKHLAYFVELAETLEPQGRGPNQKEWRRWLEDELENIRLALETGLRADPPNGLRLASALWEFWGAEGVRWLRAYLDHPANAAPTTHRGHALWRLSYMAIGPGAEDKARESLEIFRSLNDIPGQGCAQLRWGLVCELFHEDYSAARLHLEAAREIFEEIQDHWWLACTFYYLAQVALIQGGNAREIACLERALALFRETGDQSSIAVTLVLLGWSSYLYKGDLRKGYDLLIEALAINKLPIGIFRLAEVLCWQGEFEQANQLWDKMLEQARQSDDDAMVPLYNLYVGRFICLQGQLETGIALMEQAVKVFKESASLNYQLATQQTFLIELAYAHACLGEIEQAESLVAEFGHFFQADQYQPRLMALLGFLALKKGEAEASAHYYLESLRHAVQMQWRLDALLALEGYAWALRLAARPVEAARLLGAAAEFRARIGAPVFPRDRPVYDQVIAGLKNSLGEAGYAAAWAEGQAQGFDKAVDDAIKEM
jgi:predicted ATPase/DNA-binding SARP family transcriptional activator